MIPVKGFPEINFFGLVVRVHLVYSSKKQKKKGARTCIHGHDKSHPNQYQPNRGRQSLRVSPIKRSTIDDCNGRDLGRNPPLPGSAGRPPGAEKSKFF